ncbi:hypothetical protein BLNAU_18981 [Blattamonas nauphoetae]|uniref:Right handed beta helix domain-containing protein n=1 Tax=Blattamonas nauphoetae TaxID=2049346 RepID=A0ABQ9X2S6_9EUKA|nr:hypothetical protein BLNAU_18981 [Blattamonas nauphoetae]
MTNVTSRLRLISDTVRFPLVSQRVICSSISESTNHLYGTGSLDLNFGSSLCCLNSSFSQCETDSFPTEGPPTVYLQHFTTHFDHKLSASCTLFDTCTFRDIRGDRGGAIESNQAGSSLSVTKCSFFRCSSDRYGGSMFCWPSPTRSFSLSHCSFVSGTAGSYAGAIEFYACSLGSVSDCVFYDLHATKQGGALLLLHCPGQITVSDCSFASGTAQTAGGIQIEISQLVSVTDCLFYDLCATWGGGGIILKDSPGPITVSNCLFQRCRQNSTAYAGGALNVQDSECRLVSLRFRENRAGSFDKGHDVAIEKYKPTLSAASTFTDCDTDQNPIKVNYFQTPPITPDLVAAPSVLSVSSVSCVVDSDHRTATATLTVDRPISGTVLMLVDNTDNYEMPNDDSPPPITRIAESELSFGEWEQLQYEANYSFVTFGWKGTKVNTNGAVLTTPNPPRIVRAMCEGGNSEFDAFFSLKARTLATGSYKASVKGKSDF